MVSDPVPNHGAGIYPDNPQRYHQDRERGPIPRELAHGKFVDTAQNQSQLQAHEDKNDAVETELQRLPHRGTFDTCIDGQNLGILAAEIQTADHGREHAGCMNPFGRQVGQVRGGKGEGYLHRRVSDLE